ncbi:MAG: hypothetical protein JNK65_03115 [Deltaproteobacteria bacterium]|nr:hypothetical protein [Deltaproteobacteria bacterium]
MFFLILLLNLFNLRHLSRESKSEFLLRSLGLNFFLIYFFYRIHEQILFYTFAGSRISLYAWMNWSLASITLLFFILAYFMRSPAKATATGIKETLLPLICAILPFIIYDSSNWMRFAFFRNHLEYYPLIKPLYYFKGASQWIPFSLVLLGDVLVAWAAFYLRKSFSILTEVREWVYQGPYQYIRHPFYLAESICTIGIALMYLSPFNIIATLLFLVLQRWRAHIEELKLEKYIPEYKIYRNQTGAYFPKM